MEPPSNEVAMIPFPFWLMTPAGPAAETGERPLPLAFSSVERMSEYLKVQSQGEWAVQLVNRYSVAEVLAHLNANEVPLIRYNVCHDSGGGVEVHLADILAASRQAQ
jgi:hypothetical protein